VSCSVFVPHAEAPSPMLLVPALMKCFRSSPGTVSHITFTSEALHSPTPSEPRPCPAADPLITREFPTWEGGGVSREPAVARLVL
jgi:hypothetical protein